MLQYCIDIFLHGATVEVVFVAHGASFEGIVIYVDRYILPIYFHGSEAVTVSTVEGQIKERNIPGRGLSREFDRVDRTFDGFNFGKFFPFFGIGKRAVLGFNGKNLAVILWQI